MTAEASTEQIAYLRGEMMPASRAHIAIYDLSVVLGATVTDMTRTMGHKPFRLDDHIDRFYRSAKYARITPPVSPEETKARTLELIAHNTGLLRPEQDIGIVFFMSPGEAAVYAGRSADSASGPTFCIHSFPIQFQLFRKYYEEGAHVVVPSVRHIPPQCVDQKIKNRSRLHWWIADQETKLVDPAAITLLLDLDGNVTECSGSNFFIVHDGTIIMPSPRNVLRGISFVTVSELAEELGIPVKERDFQLYDVISADEAVLSSTPYCLAPATRINGLEIGDGRPGPIFRRLMKAWSERVGMDLVEQVMTAEYTG